MSYRARDSRGFVTLIMGRGTAGRRGGRVDSLPDQSVRVKGTIPFAQCRIVTKRDRGQAHDREQ